MSCVPRVRRLILVRSWADPRRPEPSLGVFCDEGWRGARKPASLADEANPLSALYLVIPALSNEEGRQPCDRQPVMGNVRYCLGWLAIHSKARIARRLSSSRLFRPKLV
jgi:hypothetical protein